MIYICTEGALELTTSQGAYSMKKGETLLLPACVNHVVLEPEQQSELFKAELFQWLTQV